MLAITTEAERALCHFLLSLDWVTRVAVGHQQVDALLPDLLPEPRAAQVIGASDFLWIRPLDVPGMLQSRGYTAEAELVLEVTDRLGLAAGRFLLTAAPEGADCVPTGRGADLTLEAGTLGTLYLGDQPASRLAALGLISEHTPGAAALADRLLYTARRPWAYDIF
jgi:predicted acetyltransferase